VGDPVAEGELLVDMGFAAFDVELVSEHNGFLAQIMVNASELCVCYWREKWLQCFGTFLT
jgi:hypothetical protein